MNRHLIRLPDEKNSSIKYVSLVYRSIRSFNIPPVQHRGIWTFEIAHGRIPGPWDKIPRQMPGHVERYWIQMFVQMPGPTPPIG